MIIFGLVAGLASTAAGCGGHPHDAAGPVTKAVTMDGGRLDLTVESSFRGTASGTGPVLWVQVKLHNLTGRKLTRSVKLPYKVVDASGNPDPDKFASLTTSEVLLHGHGYDADRPTLPDGLDLGPGETVVGFLAFPPPRQAFTPAAFRFDLNGATDWPLAGLPDQPVVESVPPPAAAVPAGRTVMLTGTGYDPEFAAKVPTALRVAISQLRDGDVDRPPPKGYRSVVGTIEITNIGRRTYLTDPLFSVLAFDTTGHAFAPAPAIPPGMLREGAVAPGGTVRGTVSFFLPQQARLSHVRFTLAKGDTHATAWWIA